MLSSLSRIYTWQKKGFFSLVFLSTWRKFCMLFNICCCMPASFWLFFFFVFHNSSKVVVSCQLQGFGASRICQCWNFSLHCIGNAIYSSGFGAGQDPNGWCITVTDIFLVKWDAPNISYWLAFVLVLKEMEVQDVVQLSAVETYSLAHVLAKAQT